MTRALPLLALLCLVLASALVLGCEKDYIDRVTAPNPCEPETVMVVVYDTVYVDVDDNGGRK